MIEFILGGVCGYILKGSNATQEEDKTVQQPQLKRQLTIHEFNEQCRNAYQLQNKLGRF